VRREKPRDWSKYPEICDLIAGKAPSRTDDKQITFFLNNVGTGVQFAAMGLLRIPRREGKKGWDEKSSANGSCRTLSRNAGGNLRPYLAKKTIGPPAFHQISVRQALHQLRICLLIDPLKLPVAHQYLAIDHHGFAHR
jgi:hypothetical protein